MNENEQQQLHSMLEDIARDLDQLLNRGSENRKIGFVLMVFPYDDRSGKCSYAANGVSPHDIIRMFKYQINRLRKTIHEARHPSVAQRKPNS